MRAGSSSLFLVAWGRKPLPVAYRVADLHKNFFIPTPGSAPTSALHP